MNGHLRLRMIISAALAMLTGIAAFLAAEWFLSFTPVWPDVAHFLALLVGSSVCGMTSGYLRKRGLIIGPIDIVSRVGFRAPFWICLAISISIVMGALYFLTDEQTRSRHPWGSIYWTIFVNIVLVDLIYWVCLPAIDAITARSGRFRFIMSREG